MIDPTTNVGKLRLKVGDVQDLPILPDLVYSQTLTDNNDNINRSAQTIAGYIAAILSQRTKERLSFIEINGADTFDNYMQFIKQVMLNPSMSGVSPIPYSGTDSSTNQLIKFTQDWYGGFSTITQSEDMDIIANGGSYDESI